MMLRKPSIQMVMDLVTMHREPMGTIVPETGTSTGNLRGCIDSDGDSWADSEDIVPNIGTQWKDTDGDGYYDNFANSIWADDVMRINGSWPGELIPVLELLTVVHFMQMSCKTWKILAVLLTFSLLGKRKWRVNIPIQSTDSEGIGTLTIIIIATDHFVNRDWRCSHTLCESRRRNRNAAKNPTKSRRNGGN